MPAEYAAIGQPDGPQPFTLENLVSIATLVGGIFGNGGGQQLANAVLYQNMAQKFGAEHQVVDGSPTVIKVKKKTKKKKTKKKKGNRKAARPITPGFATFMSFDDPNDPEAPTTIHGGRFPYQTLPRPSAAVAKTIALPDPGSVQYANHVVAGAAPSGQIRSAHASGQGHSGLGLGTAANAGPGLLQFPRSMSNALLVSAKDSASGHPLAVMGPQVSYFAPEILMEEDIHGPGIDADGRGLPGRQPVRRARPRPGLRLVGDLGGPEHRRHVRRAAVQPVRGHGLDRLRRLRAQRPVRADGDADRPESWTPNLADSDTGGLGHAPRRSSGTALRPRELRPRRRVRRANHRSVVYTNLRSTYMHELDSAAGFQDVQRAGARCAARRTSSTRPTRSATRSTGSTPTTSNIAYFNSGHEPGPRAPNTDPLFPTWSTDAWRGYTRRPR